MDINGIESLALLDTGASVSLINESLINDQSKRITKFEKAVFDATGNEIPIIGQLNIKIIVPEGFLNENILVFRDNNSLKVDIILGMNILGGTKIDFKSRTVTFSNAKMIERSNFDGLVIRLLSRNIIDKTGKYITRGIYVQVDV